MHWKPPSTASPIPATPPAIPCFGPGCGARPTPSLPRAGRRCDRAGRLPTSSSAGTRRFSRQWRTWRAPASLPAARRASRRSGLSSRVRYSLVLLGIALVVAHRAERSSRSMWSTGCSGNCAGRRPNWRTFPRAPCATRKRPRAGSLEKCTTISDRRSAPSKPTSSPCSTPAPFTRAGWRTAWVW